MMLNEKMKLRKEKAKDENLKGIDKIRDVVLLIIKCHILTFSNKLVYKVHYQQNCCIKKTYR